MLEKCGASVRIDGENRRHTQRSDLVRWLVGSVPLLHLGMRHKGLVQRNHVRERLLCDQTHVVSQVSHRFDPISRDETRTKTVAGMPMKPLENLYVWHKRRGSIRYEPHHRHSSRECDTYQAKNVPSLRSAIVRCSPATHGAAWLRASTRCHRPNTRSHQC